MKTTEKLWAKVVLNEKGAKGKARYFYDPLRKIVRRVVYTQTTFGVRSATQYRYFHTRKWVNKIADLGPSEPEYHI